MNDLPLPTLQGTRCSLRALRPDDAASLQRHADDPAVARNLFEGFPQPYTRAHADAWCRHEHRLPQFAHVFGIAVDGDQVAGCISATPQTGIWGSSAIVGYWLGQAWWGRGITTEALQLITAWAWAALPGSCRLWAPICARNLASQRVAQKAGWQLEARLPMAVRRHGEVLDAVQFATYRT